MAETGFAYSGSELESFAVADNYFRWIMEMFGERVRGRVLEVGAGLGTTSDWLLQQRGTEQLVLIEPADNLFQRLESRFAHDPRVRACRGYFGEVELEGRFDAIVLVNVLEHIADDAAVARNAFAALRPGGSLLLFVPALPFLFGSLDHEFEHHRRYTRPGLRALLESAGLGVAELRFVHGIGVLGWFMAGKILRRRTISPAAMHLYDRMVIPWVRRLENHVAPPFGQSLLAIATRPREDE